MAVHINSRKNSSPAKRFYSGILRNVRTRRRMTMGLILILLLLNISIFSYIYGHDLRPYRYHYSDAANESLVLYYVFDNTAEPSGSYWVLDKSGNGNRGFAGGGMGRREVNDSGLLLFDGIDDSIT